MDRRASPELLTREVRGQAVAGCGTHSPSVPRLCLGTLVGPAEAQSSVGELWPCARAPRAHKSKGENRRKSLSYMGLEPMTLGS